MPNVFVEHPVQLYNGHFDDVMHVISDMLLSLDSIDDMHMRPLKLRNEEGCKVFREPASANAYQRIWKHTKDFYGDDFFPILLTIAVGELALNKLGSRGAKPVYIQNASIKMEKYWNKENIRCVGYAPELVGTKATVLSKLTQVTGKGNKKAVFKFLKAKAYYDYLDHLLQPIKEAQLNGVLLRIGQGPLSCVKKIVPYVMMFSVDSAEGYELCGTTRGLLKCRLCEGI